MERRFFGGAGPDNRRRGGSWLGNRPGAGLLLGATVLSGAVGSEAGSAKARLLPETREHTFFEGRQACPAVRKKEAPSTR